LSVAVSDRLKELLRQRALVQEHLASLDREIAAVQGRVAAQGEALPTKATPLPSRDTSSSFGDAHAAEQAAEEIMAQYKQEGQTLQSSVKRGCFLYFFAALALLGLGVLAFYLFKTRS
jgi:hypothetical protein